MYRCVIDRSACPASSWMARAGARPSLPGANRRCGATHPHGASGRLEVGYFEPWATQSWPGARSRGPTFIRPPRFLHSRESRSRLLGRAIKACSANASEAPLTRRLKSWALWGTAARWPESTGADDCLLADGEQPRHGVCRALTARRSAGISSRASRGEVSTRSWRRGANRRMIHCWMR